MSNKKLATIDLQTGEIVKYDPAKGAMEIHSLDAMERLAMRVKDIDALEKALARKLEAQREFGQHYSKFFSRGKRTDLTYDSTVVSAADYCKQFGFMLRTIQRWCERLLDEAKFEAEKNKIVKRCKELAEMWQSASFSSESVEWYTPEKYIKAVRDVLGEIDLDPASCDEANKVIRASQIFTSDDDGLSQDWHDRFFLNPPYGKKDGDSLAAAFCQKAIAEYDLGNAKAGIILVNSVHSQNWQACLYDFPVCFVDHRIQFVSGDGEENKNPTFQNIFVYLGPDKLKFAEVFGKFGYVMEKIK